ncbi:lytic polysaccharide monooxygenase [Serratia plymuthica]|uniref:Chitin-binding protein n=1 Tax=Serratia plymuthica S13 TaxID=1348660 RepID=S4YNX6_SERPL|nr:lytic polysaccharide monooxygenase [Serratia plymuthica]AGP46962.1 chitin-binding protein [Serratia plymuthica S13]ANJ98234.1 chitin-binding protein [Serratia plymuthica]EKF64904.1 hypothetical protein B194_2124 [Serratia plymuthica A30]KYG18490.1 Chitin binding domain protein [Serratia plymuthica]MBI6137093.1 lytic polysaccharide monooxygenase [Serratia plymuthica]
MKKRFSLLAGMLFALTMPAHAAENIEAKAIGPKHGATLIPKARQVICEQDGGYNHPDDGSNIPNAACRNAFLYKAETIPIWERRQMFTEWPAYSQNLQGTQHPSDKVPDGQLCSAGIAKFEGIDQPHADWYVSSVSVKDGQATLYFDATQVHEPSKWTVSLAKPSFNAATDKLKWSDLTPLEVTKVTVPPPAKGNHVKYAGVYQIEVKIPADRADGKQTLLYVQWERQDPARETFFSCSDVRFNGESAAK